MISDHIYIDYGLFLHKHFLLCLTRTERVVSHCGEDWLMNKGKHFALKCHVRFD